VGQRHVRQFVNSTGSDGDQVIDGRGSGIRVGDVGVNPLAAEVAAPTVTIADFLQRELLALHLGTTTHGVLAAPVAS
jgi:hypothetical protein